MYISPSVLFPDVQIPLCVLHPLLCVCTVVLLVHRLPADFFDSRAFHCSLVSVPQLFPTPLSGYWPRTFEPRIHFRSGK
jgi:hypothetical protein